MPAHIVVFEFQIQRVPSKKPAWDLVPSVAAEEVVGANGSVQLRAVVAGAQGLNRALEGAAAGFGPGLLVEGIVFGLQLATGPCQVGEVALEVVFGHAVLEAEEAFGCDSEPGALWQIHREVSKGSRQWLISGKCNCDQQPSSNVDTDR